MSSYVRAAGVGVNGAEEPVKDTRPFFISSCFINLTLCSSVTVYILVELLRSDSFLTLHTPLVVLSAVTAVLIVAIFWMSLLSVIGVWMRHKNMLFYCCVGCGVCGVMLVFGVVWSVMLWNGFWTDSFKDKYDANAPCPRLPNRHPPCCGWDTQCTPATAPQCPLPEMSNTTCLHIINEDISDFALRVVPISIGIMILCGVAAVLGPMSSQVWQYLSMAIAEE